MGDKSVETLSNKIEFLTILVTFSPFPPKQCWFFYFFDCTDHSAYTTLNWGAGGIRELTLEANKIEHMLKYRKASFPKSVSTTFVAHCLEAIYANCGDFLFILYSRKFIFIQATKCVVQRDSWLKKSDNCFFSRQKSDTKTKPGVSLIHVWSSGGCLSRPVHF